MRISMVVLAFVVGACGSVQEDPPPDGPPGSQADAGPDGGTEPGVDAGIDAEVVSCTPDAFIACADDETARFCNAAGDGFADEACGQPGCNAGAARCNECVPSTQVCDGNVVESCTADGLALPDETCALSCVDAPSAHCAYLAPKYLPDVCDDVATAATYTVPTAVTLDTALDSNCTGGIVSQSGPQICVIRARTITVGAPLTVTGHRVLALVADDALTVTSTIDISANGQNNGPGGGLRTSGARANSNIGGGGAGFRQSGAGGGGVSSDGSGAAGGGAFDPLAVTGFSGGARPAGPVIGVGVNGGGGGGAATLIACRGTVTMSGLIDAGGGGGGAGYDTILGPQLAMHGGGGGGSGGYVVIQGLGVSVTGRLFANGGGGGGGGVSDGAGGVGGDALRSSSTAAGGGTAGMASSGNGGTGGTGGTGASSPQVGRQGSSGSPGGGGGSTGRFQVYTPASVTPTLSPMDVSPPFEANLTVPTK